MIQGGVRVERATTQFHLNTRGATYDNNYNGLFPSGLVAYNVDESRQVKLSYSTRIRRPDDTDQIDPTLHYQDALNIQRGNPNLKPEYIRARFAGCFSASIGRSESRRRSMRANRSIRGTTGRLDFLQDRFASP